MYEEKLKNVLKENPLKKTKSRYQIFNWKKKQDLFKKSTSSVIIEGTFLT